MAYFKRVVGREDRSELLKARVESARKAVEQAEDELNKAEGDQIELWKNRLSQRKEDLQRLMDEMSPDQKDIAA